ncbi:MAG: glycoside hydrolase family 38 N-terminal domain-containing protein [Planctomycetota bacterium]|jgi:alpha-amylase/alpha-mannosidase (GH57 family)
MKYIVIFHANLNYAYLTSDRYEFVIRQSYEMVIDTMRENFPDAKYVFEASGYTIDQIARRTPDVLEKLKDAVKQGQCEFMGSPYAHPMLANFPEEDGLWAIKFSNESYKKHLGIIPKSLWNPECGWRSYVPNQVKNAGYKNLLGDFEAYSRSCDSAGKPLRPKIYEKEVAEKKEEKFYDFGFEYDLPGTEKAIHFPFDKIAGLKQNKLRMFLRTDRIAQFGVRYFMGMEDYTLEKYLELIKKYSSQKQNEAEGALIIFADDVEYIGTNGWFRLKYKNEPDNIFEPTPQSRQKLIDLVAECLKSGELITFDDACNNFPCLPETITFDDDSAWHGARASTWANTPIAQLLRPWQDLVRDKLKNLSQNLGNDTLRKAWFHLTNSYNSDGQWPPTLPDAPHIVHPFNYSYCFENLLLAELLVGGVDRSKLDTDPAETLNKVLSIQQRLVLEKAEKMIGSNNTNDKLNGQKGKEIIIKSMDISSLKKSDKKILYPAEYKVRADALVEARRLVNGVVIEQLNKAKQN